MPTKQLTTLAEHGPHGQKVRVYIEQDLVRVRWTENGARKSKSWQDTPANRKEAKAYAKAFYDARATSGFPASVAAPVKVSLTMPALWSAFVTAEFPHLRPQTVRNYTAYWRKWEAFVGAIAVDEVTRETLDRYMLALQKVHVATEARRYVKLVLHVYTWAVERDLTAATKVATYRVKLSRDAKKAVPTAEYRREEAEKIQAYLTTGIASRKWRALVIQVLLHIQAARINAILHLKITDIDLDARTVTWRSEFDKTGKERVQPLPQVSVDALRYALSWREKDGYTGPWLFYSNQWRQKDQPHTYMAYWLHLQKAERAAGIAHVERRAAHGFRRGAAGDVMAMTGDLKATAQWLGHADLKMISLYLKDRNDRVQGVSDRIDERTQTAISTFTPILTTLAKDVKPSVQPATAFITSTPGGTRTHDLRIKSPLL